LIFCCLSSYHLKLRSCLWLFAAVYKSYLWAALYTPRIVPQPSAQAIASIWADLPLYQKRKMMKGIDYLQN